MAQGTAVNAVWSAVEIALPRQLATAGGDTPRVAKLANYMPFYSTVFDDRAPVRVLEIGSFYEDSLQMWQEYLHADSVIVSVDLSSRLVRIADSSGIHVRVCNGQVGPLLSEVSAEFGPFDLIVDAGSLTTAHLAEAFRHLFPVALAADGTFAAEDVYCDYWSIFNRMSFGDLGAALVDGLFGHYQVATEPSKFQLGHIILARKMNSA